MSESLTFALFLCLACSCGLGCKQPSAAKAPPTSTNAGKEVTFKGDGIELAGTLLMPKDGPGLVPAMLLLPGSGPTDRDGNSGNGAVTIKTDILKQIAERLAAEGVASLRFDKRAMIRYQALWPKSAAEIDKFFAFSHFINDANSARYFLRAQPRIDPARVGILGHSEGGLYAMEIASNAAKAVQPRKNLQLWKIVLMSAAGRPLGPLVHDQLAYRLKLGAASPAETHRFLDWWDAAAAALANDKPLPPNQPAELATIVNPTVMDLSRAYSKIDPADLLANTTMPVLLLNGSDDTQVSPTADAVRLEKAIAKRRGQAKCRLEIIPGVSHNYKSTAEGGRDAFDGPVSPLALDKIAAFVTGKG